MSPRPESAEIKVRVTPRSSKNKIEVGPDGSVKAWVTAPPVDGAANASVCDLIAKSLHIGRSHVQVIAGESSRDKRVRVEGFPLEEILKKLSKTA